MFGDVSKKNQNELTPFNPQSPYAVSKVFGHYITQNYRKSYNMFAVSGILFNHESPLRGEEFVTRKIVQGFIKILKGEINYIEVGNIFAKRDWGYAKEYVEAIWKMLQQKKPDDYVIATGKTHSIKYFIDETAKCLKMKTKWQGKGLKMKLLNKKNGKTIVRINPRFFRPSEVNFLKGDAKKAKNKLKWKPKTDLKSLINLMVKEELKYF